jgi:hypothetical protein
MYTMLNIKPALLMYACGHVCMYVYEKVKSDSIWEYLIDGIYIHTYIQICIYSLTQSIHAHTYICEI